MNRQQIIRSIISDDFGCPHCSRRDECPVFLNQPHRAGQPRKNLPCLAYTYQRVADLLLEALCRIPWNEAMDVIIETRKQQTTK